MAVGPARRKQHDRLVAQLRQLDPTPGRQPVLSRHQGDQPLARQDLVAHARRPGRRLAQDADIEMLGAQLIELIPGRVFIQGQPDVGAFGAILLEDEGHQLVGGRGGVADPQIADDALVGRARHRDARSAWVTARRASSRNMAPAAVRSICRPRRWNSAVAELLLELLDRHGERRLGHAEPLGGATKAQLVGDRDELLEAPQRHHVEIAFPAVDIERPILAAHPGGLTPARYPITSVPMVPRKGMKRGKRFRTATSDAAAAPATVGGEPSAI